MLTKSWKFYDVVECLPSEQEVKELSSNSSGMYSEGIVSHLCRGQTLHFRGFLHYFPKYVSKEDTSTPLLTFFGTFIETLLPLMLAIETLQVMIYFY
jgi:hypothetical protein